MNVSMYKILTYHVTNPAGHSINKTHYVQNLNGKYPQLIQSAIIFWICICGKYVYHVGQPHISVAN